MGKKGSWISAVKKALSPESKEKKEKVLHGFDVRFSFIACLMFWFGNLMESVAILIAENKQI